MNINTRTTVNENTPDCRWSIEWTLSIKTKFDRPLAPEYYKTYYEARKRCWNVESEGNFIGNIKYLGSKNSKK